MRKIKGIRYKPNDVENNGDAVTRIYTVGIDIKFVDEQNYHQNCIEIHNPDLDTAIHLRALIYKFLQSQGVSLRNDLILEVK